MAEIDPARKAALQLLRLLEEAYDVARNDPKIPDAFEAVKALAYGIGIPREDAADVAEAARIMWMRHHGNPGLRNDFSIAASPILRELGKVGYD